MRDKAKKNGLVSDKMNSLVRKWTFKNARWYQFWMPQSGGIGGFIAGIIVIIALIAICNIL